MKYTLLSMKSQTRKAAKKAITDQKSCSEILANIRSGNMDLKTKRSEELPLSWTTPLFKRWEKQIMMVPNNWRDKIVLLMAMFMISIMSVSISLAEADVTAHQEATVPVGMTGKCICSGSQVRDEPNMEIRKAAEQGNAEGQRKLGLKYFNGNGVPEDYQKAVEWYRKAAEQGDEMAQWFLGGMYDEGKGVPKDINQALLWYAKAAEQGSVRAQFRLGEIFSEGQGVSQDDMVAYAWYSLASTQGDVIALKKRNLIAEKFSPEQHCKAQALVDGLQSKIDSKRK